MSDDDRWTPVSGPGDRYCSPRCGRGCTRAEYEHAVESAERMVAELGEGWEPDVWENLGWHWSASRDNCITVYQVGHSGRYHCLAGGKIHGDALWTTQEFAATPLEAAQTEARSALRVAREKLALAECIARAAGLDPETGPLHRTRPGFFPTGSLHDAPARLLLGRCYFSQDSHPKRCPEAIGTEKGA